MQPEETTDLTAREQQAATIRLRLAVAEKIVGAISSSKPRPYDPWVVLAWVLTGDPVGEAGTICWRVCDMPLRLDLLSFLARMEDFKDELGTVLDVVAAADEVLAWLQADHVNRCPRHYWVQACEPRQVDADGKPVSHPVGWYVRVANPPAARTFFGKPEDALS